MSATPIGLGPESALMFLAARVAVASAALAVALAIGWQVSAWRGQSLRLCAGHLRQTRRQGPGHDVMLSLKTGVGCVGTCWALMLLPMSLGSDGRALMALVTLGLVVERLFVVRAALTPQCAAAVPFTPTPSGKPVTS